MLHGLRWAALAVVFACVALTFPALADPKFPALTGRVVDDAHVLSSSEQADLTGKLADLEQRTSRQLVVVTVPDLQGYEIEDYGYQLGRAWGVGSKANNDGVLFIIAPGERKVRIEVGYGLEPILTDALSSMILQTKVLPRFRDGDMPGGIVAGADAILEQLALPEDEAKARVAKAVQAPKHSSGGIPGIVVLVILFFVFSALSGMGRRRSGLGAALPWIILGSLSNRGGRNDWGGGGGGWGGGGGGFSGGGGSFGGGGSSGSW